MAMKINGVDPEKLKLKMENLKLKGELKKKKQRNKEKVEGIRIQYIKKQ